jgi:hypothetical protein
MSIMVMVCIWSACSCMVGVMVKRCILLFYRYDACDFDLALQ